MNAWGGMLQLEVSCRCNYEKLARVLHTSSRERTSFKYTAAQGGYTLPANIIFPVPYPGGSETTASQNGEALGSWQASTSKPFSLYCRVKWREVAQSCPTLCDPLDCSPPDSSAHGIFQAWILEWVTFPSPGDLPDPGIEPGPPSL